MTDEARMERDENGLVAASEGWFAVNVREAAWVTSEKFGAACIFEGGAAPFAQVGYTLCVLEPGQPNGMYHREGDQEDFLVLSGECLRSWKARSGGCRRGTSCTARPSPTTSSSAPATGRA